MLTNEETKALVLNRIRRSRETWAETKGIIEGGYWLLCLLLYGFSIAA